MSEDEEADLIRNLFNAFCRLEISLMMYLTVLLKTDQFRARIVWESAGGFQQRLQLIRRLVEQFASDSERKEVLSKLSEAQSASAIRNEFAHSIFSPSDEGFLLLNSVKFHKAKGRELLDGKRIGNDEVLAAIAKFEVLLAFFASRGMVMLTNNPEDLDDFVHSSSKWHRDFFEENAG